MPSGIESDCLAAGFSGPVKIRQPELADLAGVSINTVVAGSPSQAPGNAAVEGAGVKVESYFASAREIV